MIRNLWISAVQVLGFLRKELVEILRQPKLIGLLVFGPFAILLLFGVGYDNQPAPLKTTFVAPEGSVYQQVVGQYTDELSDWIRPEGFTPDEGVAMDELRRGAVDVVVVFPADPMASVLSGQQATIRVVHEQLDPIQATAISFATKLAVDRVNSAILAQIVGKGQQAIEPLGPVRQGIVVASQQLGEAVQRADPVGLKAAAGSLGQRAGEADTVVSATASFFRQFERQAGNAQVRLLDQAHAALAIVQTSAGKIVSSAPADQQAIAAEIVTTTANVTTLLGQLQTVDPAVLVQPFSGEADVAVAHPVGMTDFYAPGAIALLIQHLGITFGALSFVRDRALGLFEMLRVGPVTPAQTLLGKYGAYSVVGAAVAAALSALVVVGLDVPLAGPVTWVVVVLALVLVASLGLGFLVSLVARSDSQAVQFAMLMLLASLFFGGFFLSLSQLTYPVEAISLLLPVRYGIAALQDVMLRGDVPAATDIAGLSILAVVGFAGSWYLLRRGLRVR